MLHPILSVVPLQRSVDIRNRTPFLRAKSRRGSVEIIHYGINSSSMLLSLVQIFHVEYDYKSSLPSKGPRRSPHCAETSVKEMLVGFCSLQTKTGPST